MTNRTVCNSCGGEFDPIRFNHECARSVPVSGNTLEGNDANRIEAVKSEWAEILNHMWKCTTPACACLMTAERVMDEMKNQIEAWE